MTYSNSVNEILRIVDTRKLEKSYANKKYSSRIDFIDIEARNTFSIKDVVASMIKCANGYNHYSVRESIINKNIIRNKCLRYSEIEM